MKPETAILPDGFKMTELGPLPEEWQVVRLGNLVEQGTLFIRNGFPQGEHNQSGRGIPHLRPFNISDDGCIDLSQIKYVPPPSSDSPWWLARGDVIFNNTNSEELVGKTAFFYLDGPFVLSNHMTIIRVIDPTAIDAYWLAKLLYLQWRLGVFAALCRRHVNQASVSLERLKGVMLPLPPLPEQRAIAQVLRTVQEAKEATERVVQAARELKKSLMQHLFTYGPVPLDQADRVPLQETEIGPIPQHWQVVRLGEVAKLRSVTVDPSEFPQMPYVGLEHIIPGEIKIKAWGYGTQVRSAKTRFYSGDILYGKLRPYLDKAALAQFEGICSTDILVISANDNKIAAEFLAYGFHTASFLAYATSTMTGVNHPRTSWAALSKYLIPLPPLPEQQEIARILQAVDEKIAAEERRKGALEALFQTLLHHLMTGKIRLGDGGDGAAAPQRLEDAR